MTTQHAPNHIILNGMLKNIGKPYPSPAHTLSFPDLGPPMLKPDRRLWFYYIVVRNLDICRRYLHDDRPTSIAKVKIYRGIS